MGHSGFPQELRYAGLGDRKGGEKSLENMAACCSRSLWYRTLLIRKQLSYLLQLNRPERGLPKGWIPGPTASRCPAGNCWPAKMTCGGHFPRGLREPVLAALGTCFLSDTLTSRSLWGLCAVSVKVRRTVVFDSYPLSSPGKFIKETRTLLKMGMDPWKAAECLKPK